MARPENTEVLLHADAEGVADALAARLVTRFSEIQGGNRVPSVVLTGGGIANRAYRRLAAEGTNSSVDWSRVEWWWGDERFVAADDPDRNFKQAMDVLTASLSLDPDRIHPIAASDSGVDLDTAAAQYADEVASASFDICLLGLGPDGHVASIFPEHPSSYAEGTVIAVRASPKPPPERVSMTLPLINQSREVWFAVSGEDKAAAAAMALLGTGPVQVPAAGVAGSHSTLWLVDRAAASKLPSQLVQRRI